MNNENLNEILERHLEISEKLHDLIILSEMKFDDLLFLLSAEENVMKSYVLLKCLMVKHDR